MDMRIRIEAIDGTQMAAKINGTFTINGSSDYPFEAIAFGRIGGQNIGAKITEAVRGRLQGAGYDPEEVVMRLQTGLLQGDLTLPEGLTRETFADGSMDPGRGGQ